MGGGGGPGPSDIKTFLTTLFFSQLILQKSYCLFESVLNYNFPLFQRGYNNFKGVGPIFPIAYSL